VLQGENKGDKGDKKLNDEGKKRRRKRKEKETH
jgi:hypothetical protein